MCEKSKVQKTVYGALPLMKKRASDKYVYDYTFMDYLYKETKIGNSIRFWEGYWEKGMGEIFFIL